MGVPLLFLTLPYVRATPDITEVTDYVRSLPPESRRSFVESSNMLPILRRAATLLLCTLAFGQASAPAGTPVAINISAEALGLTKDEENRVLDLLESDQAADWDRARASSLRFHYVNLSAGKSDGLLVRSTASSDCGAPGNCPVWLLRKDGSDLQLALSGIADEVLLSEQTSHELRNVVLKANNSADTSEVILFVFDGQKYNSDTCYLETNRGSSAKSTQKVPCK